MSKEPDKDDQNTKHPAFGPLINAMEEKKSAELTSQPKTFPEL
eukprot:CAMPEP_0168352154 /NCGR_PEP_ID=MMETSP0213-20121227/22367_1 /TAXON_ID=151035 /ORGANISM="Euplotes harpa, Strain FSP1.4" /LENGTH=42 /DNA_ID= /DNA_START= /DNA_END= /DNA_ORIENTATION=